MSHAKFNVIFASYREWANAVFIAVSKHPRVNCALHATDHEELKRLIETHAFDVDLVILCGWSWPPEQWMVNAGPLVISEHPAASDRYTPGTPLQNQIIDGLKITKHRVVKVGYPELSPHLWSHEVDMSLEGHMDEILDRMRSTSIHLFNAFLDDYSKIEWKPWPIVPSTCQMSRRTPEMSDVTELLVDSGRMPSTALELYNAIRCLETPYPNAYFEDRTGRLYFERVRFEPKDSK